MYRAIKSFTFEGDEYVSDLTRVAADHPARELHPENFTYDPWAPAVSERSIERAREGWTPDELELAGQAVDESRKRITELAQNPANREAGVPPAPGVRRRDTGPNSEAREAGLRAVDEMRNMLSAAAGDRLETVIRKDRVGVDSRYIAATSNPDYLSAFGKRLASPEGAAHEYTATEAEAVRQVAQVLAEQRALGVSSGDTGAFAIPASLDPSLMLTTDGRINPIRELATTTTIVGSYWEGVNTEGVVGHWYKEAEEVSDDSPALTQPTIKPERLSIFVPFSIEVGQDWTSLQTELAQLFADAKDELEAEAFTTGSGVDEPYGLLTAGSAVSGGTATTVANYYALQEALPPRWQPRATFLSSNSQQNIAFRAVSEGDTDEPKFIDSSRQSILNRPWREVSHMASGTAAGTVAAYGDIASTYRVVDRIGGQVEVIQHLFGTANNRPTGQRGLFYYARVGGSVTVANALRVLVTS